MCYGASMAVRRRRAGRSEQTTPGAGKELRKSNGGSGSGLRTWRQVLRCVGCGERFTHFDVTDSEAGPRSWPGDCPECGGSLIGGRWHVYNGPRADGRL
jgi:hypothetical protein